MDSQKFFDNAQEMFFKRNVACKFRCKLECVYCNQEVLGKSFNFPDIEGEFLNTEEEQHITFRESLPLFSPQENRPFTPQNSIFSYNIEPNMIFITGVFGQKLKGPFPYIMKIVPQLNTIQARQS